jgi:gluconate 2-dehydrogenase gamma chain
MNRREFLQCATILTGGTAISQLGWALSEEQQVYLAGAPNFNTQEIDFFSLEQRAVVAAVAETIIPRTDTPGAIDAGVPRYIELMVAQWLNEDEQKIFLTGLAKLQSDSLESQGVSFDALDETSRVAMLDALESAASDSAWYEMGNTRRDFISDAPFICQIKELTVWGFFTSEVGSTQVLRYEPMPMRFDGDIPLLPDDSTWAHRGI